MPGVMDGANARFAASAAGVAERIAGQKWPDFRRAGAPGARAAFPRLKANKQKK